MESDQPRMSSAGNNNDRATAQIRVLIIDDDENHAEAVAESLSRVGYECVVASSGQKGVSLIESDSFDIVITDEQDRRICSARLTVLLRDLGA